VNKSIKLPDNGIFCFGSNEAGIHGKGAAAFANQRFGAKWRQGWGLAGRSFAIPTKNRHMKTLPLSDIKSYVEAFKVFAREHPDNIFFVTRIGCGLAGIKDSIMAKMFSDSPSNCLFDFEWTKYIDCQSFGPHASIIE